LLTPNNLDAVTVILSPNFALHLPQYLTHKIYVTLSPYNQHGYVLRKEDNDWVKKCMEYEVEWRAPDQEVDERGHAERLCKKDCQARNLNREDAMDCGRWKKLIKIG